MCSVPIVQPRRPSEQRSSPNLFFSSQEMNYGPSALKHCALNLNIKGLTLYNDVNVSGITLRRGVGTNDDNKMAVRATIQMTDHQLTTSGSKFPVYLSIKVGDSIYVGNGC